MARTEAVFRLLIDAHEPMKHLSNIALIAPPLGWLLAKESLGMVSNSFTASVLAVMGLVVLASWGAFKALARLSSYLRPQDREGLYTTLGRMAVPGAVASALMTVLLIDMLAARLRAVDDEWDARRVACTTTSSASGRVSSARDVVDGQACFGSASGTGPIVRIDQGDIAQPVGVGQPVRVELKAGRSLVFGEKAYFFAPKINII
jgi:hypothetical protein